MDNEQSEYDYLEIDYADAERKIAYGLATRREVEALERQATALEAIYDELHTISAIAVGVVLGVTLTMVLIVILGLTTTLFEDGSVQFFNRAGWGFCLLPSWGCS